MHITIATFKAYDKEVKHFWEDESKPSIEQIELRILDICQTSVIKDIKIYKVIEEK